MSFLAEGTSALILLLAAGASASSLGFTKDRARPAMTTLVAAKPKAPVVPFYAQADNQFKVTVLAAVVGSAYLGTMPGMVAAVVAALTDVTAVATTFGTYMLADTLSNFIQHPTQKMDYGFINKFIGREVDEAWWGTRTEHIVGVAGALALTDHASTAIFSKLLGKSLSFAAAPAAFIAHTFIFIHVGVSLYVAYDAALNPAHAADRQAEFMSGVSASYVGSNTAWFEPFVGPTLGKFAGAAAGTSWWGGSLLPATLAYSTVKGVGWNDWGNSGLNDHEKKLNGLK